MMDEKESSSDIFKKKFGRISQSLGREPPFIAITDLLLTKDLITQHELQSIRSRSKSTDYERGSGIAHSLYNRLRYYDDDRKDEKEAKSYLLSICDVFADKDIGDVKLRDIADEIRQLAAAGGSQYQPHCTNDKTLMKATGGISQGQAITEEVDAPNIPNFCDVKMWCPLLESLNFDVKTDNIEDRVKDVNVLLVTATDTELRAVIGNRNEDSECIILKDPNLKVAFYLARYAQYQVAIVKTGQGEKKTRQKVEEVQKVVKAKYVIAIGICYGMKQKATLDIGDIIVSEKIKDITNTREEVDRTLFRVDDYPVDEQLLAILSTPGIGFRFEKELGTGKCVQINTGVLVSETSLSAAQTRKDKILLQIPEALGGEMEGNGIMEAAKQSGHYHGIVVKAVADWGNEDKAPYRKCQEFAAVAAAQYVHACLKKFPNELK